MHSIRRPRIPRRVKYILFEMVTITLGLLLALAIDNLAESRKQQQTVALARAALRVELEANAAALDKVMQEIGIGRAQIVANLKAVQALLRSSDPQDASKLPLDDSLGITFLYKTSSFPFLRETAWLTAQSTSALSYIPYDEAQAFNSIYEAQAEFNRHQRLFLEDSVLIISVANQVWRGGNRLSATGAAELARCYGSMVGHLNILQVSAARLSGLLRTAPGTPLVTKPSSASSAADPKK